MVWCSVWRWYTCTKTVGEAHLMFVLVKNLHLVRIRNGVRSFVDCAILVLNAVQPGSSFTGTRCHSRRTNTSLPTAKMAHEQRTGYRVGNIRCNWSDEVWYRQAPSPIIGFWRNWDFFTHRLSRIVLLPACVTVEHLIQKRRVVFTLWLVHSSSTRWRSSNPTGALVLSVVRAVWCC